MLVVVVVVVLVVVVVVVVGGSFVREKLCDTEKLSDARALTEKLCDTRALSDALSVTTTDGVRDTVVVVGIAISTERAFGVAT